MAIEITDLTSLTTAADDDVLVIVDTSANTTKQITKANLAKVITALYDSNSNEILEVAATASAVNHPKITNAATGNAPKIEAAGSDTNISLNLATKGTGVVQVNGTALTGASGTIFWQEIARTTLGVAGDTITVSSIPARKYLKIIISAKATAGGTLAGQTLRFNNDSGANYADRYEANGAADVTDVSATGLLFRPGSIAASGAMYVEGEFTNIAATEKMGIWYGSGGATGAATSPSRLLGAGKWVNTSAQINRVDYINVSGTGDFAIDSEVIILGHD